MYSILLITSFGKILKSFKELLDDSKSYLRELFDKKLIDSAYCNIIVFSFFSVRKEPNSNVKSLAKTCKYDVKLSSH